MAAVGSAVGLGNVWRFPYLSYKYGGGAFLIPYLIALFLIGIPLLMLEFGLGQMMQRGAVDAYKKIHPRFRGLGWLALITGFIISTYYVVVMAWTLIYLIVSPSVPWSSDPKAYFFSNVLQITDSVAVIGGVNLTILLALLAVWVLIYFSVFRGVKSVGKVVMLTVPLPVILLAVLLVRAVTLPGFLTGWGYYLRPSWEALLSSEVWLAAASQIFFTLTLGFGVMIAYASHKKEDSDVAKDSFLTSIINSGISLFAGFVVFGILGYMSVQTGTPVQDVAVAGPSLAFVVFPKALALMPWAGFFSAVFFLTLLTLGIDSAFSLVEGINVAIRDAKKSVTTQKVSLYVCIAGFLAGIIYTTRAGLYFLDIVDHFATNFNLVIVGILEAVLVGWIYGAKKLRAYINKVSDFRIGKWFDLAIMLVIPLSLLALLAKQLVTEIKAPYEGYPAWALGAGWLAVALPLLVFLYFFAFPGNAKRSSA